MKALRQIVYCLLLCSLTLGGIATAQNVEFSYDGRVRTSGVPFNGNGQFKFAIVSTNGMICYWANDGVTLTGDEPTSSLQITVSNGFFSVIIGDETISGMAPLDAAIFNTDERVRLRVWFNDGVNGFQELSPDRQIANPGLIGLQSNRTSVVYVNPITGNDQYSGLSSVRAKKTISAAWDALPSIIGSTVTIQLAPAGYFEAPVLGRKQVTNEARIVLRGDPNNPSNYKISGALDVATSTTAAHYNALRIYQQQGLVLNGLYIEKGKEFGVVIIYGSEVEIQKCTFVQNKVGILVTAGSIINLNNSTIENGAGPTTQAIAMTIENCSTGIISNSQFLGQGSLPSAIGIISNKSSSIEIVGSTIDGFSNGVLSKASSSFSFSLGGNVILNCTTGITAVLNASVVSGQPGAGGVTFGSGVGTPNVSQTGGVFGN